MQLEHSQFDCCFFTKSSKPLEFVLGTTSAIFPVAATACLEFIPGLGASQAAHFISPDLFWIIHVEQSHEPLGALNLSPQDERPEDEGGTALPDFGVVHAAHLVSLILFLIIQARTPIYRTSS